MLNFNVSAGDIISVGTVLAMFSIMVNNNKEVNNRLDERRKEYQDKFVSKDICKTVSANLKEAADDLKKQTECIPKIKASVDLILRKMQIDPIE